MRHCKATWSRTMWLYGRKLFTVCNHPAKFGGRGQCGIRDIIYLIFQVPLQEHLIKGSGNFIQVSSSLYLITLLGLVAISIVVVEK